MPDLNGKPALSREGVQRYLESLLGVSVRGLTMTVLGREHEQGDLKEYGYGVPLKLEFVIDGGQQRTAVLHTMSPGPFGHEHMADRAHELLWDYQAFNHLPRHVRALDICGFQPDGAILSAGKVEEFCLLTDYIEGRAYSNDLQRMRNTDALTELDMARADALCDYLVEIHKVHGTDRGLYVRRIRELVGDGECIMGITDSYPLHPAAPPDLLKKIEHLCLDWRWRLKDRTHRLRQVHGDFHPWNILFRSATDFSVLDRSRGEFGDPADDVTSLTLNYFFFSVQRHGRLQGPLEKLFRRFWERYLDKSGDSEMLEVVAPFFAFRGLVMASPLWYPKLPDAVRERLLRFVVALLEDGCFDPKKANLYAGAT